METAEEKREVENVRPADIRNWFSRVTGIGLLFRVTTRINP
jgi:hypothetical protein